jgi:hypothetical protein
MPRLTAAAGTMAAPEFVVRNASGQEVSLSSGVSVARAQPASTPDPREFFEIPKTGPPGAYETRVPPGQTRSVMSRVQLPFDSTSPVVLRAGSGIGLISGSALFASQMTRVQVDIPLQLTTPTLADDLKLELKADRQQWCLQATDSRGAKPSGPLFVALSVESGGGVGMMGEMPAGAGDAWAMRWAQSGATPLVQANPVTLKVWVGGPHYVTARAEAQINP